MLRARTNPEAVKILENGQIPGEYLVTPEPLPPRPDRTAIKAAKHIDGCYLEAGQCIEIGT